MDADSLIKLTKSNLKELVCEHFYISIPELVKIELVDRGKKHPDSLIIENNIDNQFIKIISHEKKFHKGEEALLSIYSLHENNFDLICSDDKRFLNQLKRANVPFISSGIIIVILLKNKFINKDGALKKLSDLSFFISDEEYETLLYIIKNWR